MFNRANERFRNTLTTGTTADDGRVEPGQFDHILGDGEGVHHVCSSTDGFEHETDDRTTTLAPSGDADAHLLVTDCQVLGVLGSDPADPEFRFDAWEVARVEGHDGLLSSTVEIRTAAETVRFHPDDGTDVDRVAATLDRIAAAWTDLREALDAVETAIAEYEARVADGADPDTALATVRSRLSRAHHCATKDEYAPEAAMLDEVDPLAEAVDGLRVTARLDRAERLLGEAADAREASPLTAIDAAVAAGEQLVDARDVHGDVGSTAISQRLTDLTVRLDSFCTGLLDDAMELCVAASDADDPGEALACWEMATERYRAMLDAGWDGEAGVDPPAIRYQLAWIVGNRIDALRERAAQLEAEGDDVAEDASADGDGADRYERALGCREKAREIESECPFGGSAADAIDRLEEKIARTEWQWGSA